MKHTLLALLISTSAHATGNHDLVIHVMNRLAFGPRPADIVQVEKTGPSGIDQWIREQMHPEKIDDAALERKLAQMPSLDMETKDLYLHYTNTEPPPPDTKKPYEIVKEIQAAKIIRAVESRRQLDEVLLDFWFNHFNVDLNKNDLKFVISNYQEKALRPHLFGKFKDLLLATAHHPAMLTYLDNRQSRKKNINENYAREVMELHTLGVNGGYTQGDVETLAKILTGWSVTDAKEDPHFLFKEKQHDDSATEFLGQKVEGDGEAQGVWALTQLAESAQTARFITTALVRYFVSDDPPPALVKRLSAVFTRTHGDLRQVYEALFFSPEFHSLKYAHAKIKKPLWIVASSIRGCGGEVVKTDRIQHNLAEMGEDTYKCAPPTGFVDERERWLNPGAMILRLQFALDLADHKLDGVYCSWDSDSKAHGLKNWIVELGRRHLNIDIQAPTLKVIERELAQNSLEFASHEIRPTAYLKSLALLLASPEFQRR